jgi:hypothetical protein
LLSSDGGVVAGVDVEDVHLSRAAHRTDEEDVVASRMKLGLKVNNKGLVFYTIELKC